MLLPLHMVVEEADKDVGATEGWLTVIITSSVPGVLLQLLPLGVFVVLLNVIKPLPMFGVNVEVKLVGLENVPEPAGDTMLQVAELALPPRLAPNVTKLPAQTD